MSLIVQQMLPFLVFLSDEVKSILNLYFEIYTNLKR